MKEQFLVTKLVNAEEMTMSEYYKSKEDFISDAMSKVLPEDIGNKKVYKIYYPNGYVSMCPKEIFLKTAYKIENNSIPEELVKTFIRRMDISTERVFGKLNTVVKYELINGFTGIESTSCMNESDYDEETEVNIIAKRLYDKIWFGLGFTLGMTNKKGEDE